MIDIIFLAFLFKDWFNGNYFSAKLPLDSIFIHISPSVSPLTDTLL